MGGIQRKEIYSNYSISTVNMKIIFTVLLAAVASAADLESIYSRDQLALLSTDVQEDAKLPFEGLVKKYGYPVESHTVTTKDGYILTMHRIPFGKECGRNNGTKIPVLMVHGLLSHSIDWNLMGPEKGLGYILADQCFDVWHANSRGNRISRAHISMTTKNSKFWKFSWHEMGLYDVPAMIDYILDVTDQPNLHYIGHSQGTTQFFVYNSVYPEEYKKIRSAHMLSPVALMKNLKSPLLKISLLLQFPLEVIGKLLGINELLETLDVLKFFGSEICKDEFPLLGDVCSNILFLLGGYNIDQFNKTTLPIILGHTPAGASVQQLIHYSQVIRSDEFKQYDYGALGNLMRYKSVKPPLYDLSKNKVPTAFYYGDNDWIADVKDVYRLADIYPNLIGNFRIPHKQFTHLDFLWAMDVKQLLYDDLIRIMKRY